MQDIVATVMVMLVLCGVAFMVGAHSSEKAMDAKLIKAGRCEYKVDTKTGESYIVWKGTGEKVHE